MPTLKIKEIALLILVRNLATIERITMILRGSLRLDS